MGVPSGIPYREILNSDAEVFGGSNVINPEPLEPIHEPYGEAPYHITLSLPPLSGVILKPVPEKNLNP
jgi:1,4-alpha-glucan branching enzyme